MKAYTNIEQSKKLAEILPLESADMDYIPVVNIDGEYSITVNIWNNEHVIDEGWIPCWSLAALFSVIPQEIFDGEYIINITEGCDDRWILTYDHHENRNHSYYGLSHGADNLIDACYEMILKLNEMKKLWLWN